MRFCCFCLPSTLVKIFFRSGIENLGHSRSYVLKVFTALDKKFEPLLELSFFPAAPAVQLAPVVAAVAAVAAPKPSAHEPVPQPTPEAKPVVVESLPEKLAMTAITLFEFGTFVLS